MRGYDKKRLLQKLSCSHAESREIDWTEIDKLLIDLTQDLTVLKINVVFHAFKFSLIPFVTVLEYCKQRTDPCDWVKKGKYSSPYLTVCELGYERETL